MERYLTDATWHARSAPTTTAGTARDLAIAADYALMFVTGCAALPKEWHNAYGPGSKRGDPLPVNEKATLLRRHRGRTYPRRRLQSMVLKGDLAMLEVPHGLAWVEGTALKTRAR